jgi:hypothetical protein
LSFSLAVATGELGVGVGGTTVAVSVGSDVAVGANVALGCGNKVAVGGGVT